LVNFNKKTALHTAGLFVIYICKNVISKIVFFLKKVIIFLIQEQQKLFNLTGDLS